MKTTLQNTLLFLLLALVLPATSFAQPPCENSSFQIDMKTPKAKIQHQPSGTLWFDGTDGKFEIDDPLLSPEPVVVAFAGSFWASGRDDGGNIKVAGNTYGPGTDWWPGPLGAFGETENDNCSKFDKVWELKDEDLQLFLADFADDGIINNQVPPAIFAWPGRNNPHSLAANGFALPEDEELAPFHDEDNDGNYDPLQGDYPFIKGAVVAHWWIFNDNSNIHGETNGDAMRIDVKVLAYQFDEIYEVFGSTKVYYEYDITNKSVESINDFHAGLWVDGDLGCFEDDYIGCSPEHNLGYTYNADAQDGDDNCACPGGVSTFCNGIPLFGIKILEGIRDENNEDQGLSSFHYYNNGGVGGPWDPNTTDPQDGEGYYQFLRGIWPDGTPLTRGGDGYDPTSNDVTTYAFPDPPNDPDGWSLCTEDEVASDRRMILGSGSTVLFPLESTKLAFVAIVTPAVEHPCPDISVLIEAGDDAQEIYDGLPSSIQSTQQLTELFISPNPAATFININTAGNEYIATVRLSNANGQLILEQNSIQEQAYRMDRNGLPAGMYFLEVVTADGKRGVEKILFMN